MTQTKKQQPGAKSIDKPSPALTEIQISHTTVQATILTKNTFYSPSHQNRFDDEKQVGLWVQVPAIHFPTSERTRWVWSNDISQPPCTNAKYYPELTP